MLIKGINAKTAKNKTAQTQSNADYIKDTNFNITAYQHIQAAKEHRGVAQKAFKDIIIGQGGNVAEIGVEHNADNTADRIVNMVPGVIDRVSGIIAGQKDKKAAEAETVVL